MRMVAGFVAAQCVTFCWLGWLSVPGDPKPPTEPTKVGREESASVAAAISELAGLRERVRALEAIVSASSSDRRPVQSSAEQALSASAMAPVQERELEARAQDPVDWMALERFAVRWGDRADARNERALALVGPADLARRFGPPTRIHAANGSLLWEYESSEKNAAGAPLTVVRFIVVDGCVLEVDRRSNL